MQYIKSCYICKNEKRTVIYSNTADLSNFEKISQNPHGFRYQINSCDGCGLKYSSPIMDNDQIAKLYESALATNVTSGEEVNVSKTMRLYYEIGRQYVLQRDSILDVGCDIGLLLEFAKKDGFIKLHGTEPNPTARKQANCIEDAIVSKDFYETKLYPPESFDFITFIHVVDHLIDPTIVIETAHIHLKPGGIVLAVVHDSNSILARVLGRRFPPYNIYHHFFFTKKTLANLFHSRGFEVIKTVSTKNCYSLVFFIDRIPLLPKSLKKVLRIILNFVGLGRLSITIPVGNIGVVARRKFPNNI